MGVTNMQGLLIKLFELMGVTAGDFKLSSIDGNLWRVYLPLGSISADTYEGELWGDVDLDETEATLTFAVGDLYDGNRFSIGEGEVNLNYAEGNTGLAYTSELEDVITARIKDLYNLSADGSEQGMQGSDYLSLDIFAEGVEGTKVTGEELDADEKDTELEKAVYQFIA